MSLAKARLGIGEGALGLPLLGPGSVAAMRVSGPLTSRSRQVDGVGRRVRAGAAGPSIDRVGIANTGPVLFRQAGARTARPAGLAIASLTTVGHAGTLAGPAAIGFAARHAGSPAYVTPPKVPASSA